MAKPQIDAWVKQVVENNPPTIQEVAACSVFRRVLVHDCTPEVTISVGDKEILKVRSSGRGSLSLTK